MKYDLPDWFYLPGAGSPGLSRANSRGP